MQGNLLTIWFMERNSNPPKLRYPNRRCQSQDVNLLNLILNTNKLYKNDSHNMGSKTPQKNLHNHIKIKGIKIVGSNTQKIPRALNFINQFALEHQLAFINQFASKHQLVCQTQ